MDSLLAGTLILPWRVHCAGMMFSAAVPAEDIPGIVKTIPGSGENRSPSRRNRCSPSARNPVRLHTGILFTFAPESAPTQDSVPDNCHRHKLPAGYRVAKTPVLDGLHHEYRLVKEAA